MGNTIEVPDAKSLLSHSKASDAGERDKRISFYSLSPFNPLTRFASGEGEV
jgi:hypothetical protein